MQIRRGGLDSVFQGLLPNTGWARLLTLVVVAGLGGLLAGVSCGSEQESKRPSTASEPPRDDVVDLPGVDLSRLTSSERRVFRTVVSDQLSPCGQPVSLALCVLENRDCKACKPAVAYVRRLVLAGYGEHEITGRLETRYGADAAEIPVGDAAVRGATMAPITIVEFSDFQCPACGMAHPFVHDALKSFPDRVRFVMMNYPLPSHPRAEPAARAALAAGRQGKFWEMHDQLFEHQRALEESDLRAYARTLGLDQDRFEIDVLSSEVQERLEAQKALGQRLGVDGTPTFFINGRKFLDSPRTLGEYIREELAALE